MSYLVLSDATLTAIQAEATRAHLRHGDHSMLGPDYSSGDRLAILMEEVGEVARELTYDHGGTGADHQGRRDELVKELIQVAAMAATWIEFLEGGYERASAEREAAEHKHGPDFVPGFGPVPGSGFGIDADPPGPDDRPR